MTTHLASPTIDVRRAHQRFDTDLGWLNSKHSFSFADHRDQTNTHHGLLLVNNDDLIRPGTGFSTHPHRDMEIVTWVLQGSLVHEDSEGNSGVIYPGLAQRMSAGRGIHHSEKNDSWRLTGEAAHGEPVHLVQMWVVPDETRITPSYEQLEIAPQRLASGLVPVASGMARDRNDTAIRIHNKSAALLGSRLDSGASVYLPDAPFVHLFIPRGAVDLEGTGLLIEGDAVRFTNAGGHRVVAIEPSEVLVWEMHAGLMD